MGSIWPACVTCLDVQKTSEIPHERLLRKLSTGRDVVLDQKLAEGPQTKPRSEWESECDKSRGMGSFTINDPEKIMCSKVPIPWSRSDLSRWSNSKVTPCEVKWCEVRRKWVLRSTQPGVFWKEWFVQGHVWLLNYCGYSGQQHCGPVTEMSFLNRQRCHRRNKSCSAA